MSSTKPEVHKYCVVVTEEDRATATGVTCTEKNSRSLDVMFLRYAIGQTDKQTNTQYFATPLERNNKQVHDRAIDVGQY